MKTRKQKKQLSEKDRNHKAGLTNCLGEKLSCKKDILELSEYFRERMYSDPGLDYEFRQFFERNM